MSLDDARALCLTRAEQEPRLLWTVYERRPYGSREPVSYVVLPGEQPRLIIQDGAMLWPILCLRHGGMWRHPYFCEEQPRKRRQPAGTPKCVLPDPR